MVDREQQLSSLREDERTDRLRARDTPAVDRARRGLQPMHGGAEKIDPVERSFFSVPEDTLAKLVVGLRRNAPVGRRVHEAFTHIRLPQTVPPSTGMTLPVWKRQRGKA